jgi:hypothetical protein
VISRDDDDVWYWYLRCEEFRQLEMGQTEYCKRYNVDYKSFSNMWYRITYRKYSHPAMYAEYIPITRKYLESGLTAKEFCRIHDVDRNILGCMTTHLNYVDIIERLKKTRSMDEPIVPQSKPAQSKMNFVQVKSREEIPLRTISEAKPRPPFQPIQQESNLIKQGEVIEPQNDIEIIISKGVKVSVSPNIDSMKIIKIIELLKDL